tara:strand:- start:6263 stop:6637 length:375 start_codon:yes stop_codon:yes gene_type:complete
MTETNQNKYDTIVTAINEMTAVLQSLCDVVHDSAKMQAEQQSKTIEFLDEISRGTTEIAKAFILDEESGAGSVYHIAGSLNSIKFGMPNYKPKKSKLGRAKSFQSNFKKDPVLDQHVDIQQKTK